VKRLADRFALEREVGSGGMARVFLGRDEVLDRPVAVKVLKPMHGDTEIAARFRREGRTAARLSHPNIVQVYDAGEGDLEGEEVSYIVMEYLPGGDLKELIDARGPLPGAELARIGEEVCSGLAHAHGRGVIHRDIKPHNILLDEKGRSKVSDFGIARALDTTQATRTGAYLGTALYSSPEQLQGHRVTPKSDVYSLGATLYQAAAGEPPFTGTPIEVASQHVSKPPPPLKAREAGLDIGGEMEDLILSCLAKDADERPSAEEAQRRFGDLAPMAGIVPPGAPPEPQRPPETPEERPASTVASPVGRTRRWSPAAILLPLLAILAVLAVIGAFVLPGLLDGAGDIAGQNNPQQNQQAAAGGSNNEGANEGGGSQGDGAAAANTPQPATPASQESPPPEDGQQGGSQEQGATSEEEAAQTVEDFYQTAAGPEYESSWNYLSSDQQQFPSRGSLTNQFRTLERIQFTEGPTTTQINGNTATVAASTVAYHTNRTDRLTGTANLVREGDEWKISSLNFTEA
jgi:serine/threonine-protein kinase